MKRLERIIVSWLIFLIGIGTYTCIVLGIMSMCSHDTELEKDTVQVTMVVVDTLLEKQPVPVKEEVVRYVRVPCVKESEKTEHETGGVLSYSENINAPDTENEGTSAEPTFTIPISQKEYKDSTYHAWVSGYMASLDSIEVYQRNILTTQTITAWRKPPRLSFGITGGYGYGLGSGSFEPFVGIGVSYRLWPRR